MIVYESKRRNKRENATKQAKTLFAFITYQDRKPFPSKISIGSFVYQKQRTNEKNEWKKWIHYTDGSLDFGGHLKITSSVIENVQLGQLGKAMPLIRKNIKLPKLVCQSSSSSDVSSSFISFHSRHLPENFKIIRKLGQQLQYSDQIQSIQGGKKLKSLIYQFINSLHILKIQRKISQWFSL